MGGGREMDYIMPHRTASVGFNRCGTRQQKGWTNAANMNKPFAPMRGAATAMKGPLPVPTSSRAASKRGKVGASPLAAVPAIQQASPAPISRSELTRLLSMAAAGADSISPTMSAAATTT